MHGMEFFGFHGVLPQEKLTGQKFVVDVELGLDLSKAGREDSLSATVSYAEAYENIRKIMEEERYDLIEAVAEKIAAVLLEKYPVNTVKVRVQKPHAPFAGKFVYMGVEIVRDGNNGI